MSNASEPKADSPEGTATHREVRYEYSRNLAPLLTQLGVSLLVSTYQAGKVVAVGVDRQGELALSFHNFERAMGLAVRPDRLAVGTLAQVWFLRSAPDLAPRLEPAGRHDACFLTRSSHFTGEIQVHELAWAGDELWLVNTAFCCLCTLDERPQLRAALAAAVHHGAGGRGPLPPERPGPGRRPAEVRDRPGRDRHARRAGGRTRRPAAA